MKKPFIVFTGALVEERKYIQPIYAKHIELFVYARKTGQWYDHELKPVCRETVPERFLTLQLLIN